MMPKKLRNVSYSSINLRAGGGGIPIGAAFVVAAGTEGGGAGGPAGAEVAEMLKC